MRANTLSPTSLPLGNYGKNQLTAISASRTALRTSDEALQLESDKVSLTYSAESLQIYTTSLTIEGTQGDGFDLLRGLVLNILKDQGIDYQVQTGSGEIDLSAISQEEAQELIAEDGYFGVEQTSDRIVDFAIGLAGGDTSRLDAVRQGVEQGFEEALDAFGGWLPDISYDTYDAVMAKLDIWAGSTDGPQA